MEILLATTNPHKLEEIRSVIDEPSIRFLLLCDVDPGGEIAEPIEDQDTFEANALLKARHYAAASGLLTLADDSGLEVDALGGQPGVHSARFSGVQGDRDEIDAANNLLLLKKLDKHPLDKRTARFVCTLALTAPGGDQADHQPSQELEPLALPLVIRGTVKGRILARSEVSDPNEPERGRGGHGFGYDPLFELPGDHDLYPGQTTAELTPSQKNHISHRARAAHQMWNKLEPTLLQRTGK